ncbi:hypothetical protein SAMN06298226_2065 [Nitrosovibrio sp. Nv4]|nr:hypothetical protein SAMN06298226_2065 [Nitrosovibrio sp. Nv4]
MASNTLLSNQHDFKAWNFRLCHHLGEKPKGCYRAEYTVLCFVSYSPRIRTVRDITAGTPIEANPFLCSVPCNPMIRRRPHHSHPLGIRLCIVQN